eukprot:3819044-Prymnesium_polylepis.1
MPRAALRFGGRRGIRVRLAASPRHALMLTCGGDVAIIADVWLDPSPERASRRARLVPQPLLFQGRLLTGGRVRGL